VSGGRGEEDLEARRWSSDRYGWRTGRPATGKRQPGKKTLGERAMGFFFCFGMVREIVYFTKISNFLHFFAFS